MSFLERREKYTRQCSGERNQVKSWKQPLSDSSLNTSALRALMRKTDSTHAYIYILKASSWNWTWCSSFTLPDTFWCCTVARSPLHKGTSENKMSTAEGEQLKWHVAVKREEVVNIRLLSLVTKGQGSSWQLSILIHSLIVWFAVYSLCLHGILMFTFDAN